MKRFEEQLRTKSFPLTIKDRHGNKIYTEFSNAFWQKNEFESKCNQTYHEDSEEFVQDYIQLI